MRLVSLVVIRKMTIKINLFMHNVDKIFFCLKFVYKTETKKYYSTTSKYIYGGTHEKL